MKHTLIKARHPYQTVNKITQKLDYTAQLLSTQKVITVPTFTVDVDTPS